MTWRGYNGTRSRNTNAKKIAKILLKMDIGPRTGFEIWELALIKARKWVGARKKRRETIDAILEMHERQKGI